MAAISERVARQAEVDDREVDAIDQRPRDPAHVAVGQAGRAGARAGIGAATSASVDV